MDSPIGNQLMKKKIQIQHKSRDSDSKKSGTKTPPAKDFSDTFIKKAAASTKGIDS
jgi:hypothetical protein